MKVFRLTFRKSGGIFAHASGYGPIDDLWFLPPAFLAQFRAFWAVSPSSPGMSIDPGGKMWPDVLSCGNSPPPFFIGERILHSLQQIGAPMGKVTEMPIAEIDPKVLRAKSPPRYYVIETIPGIEVNFPASGIPTDSSGNAILTPLPKPWPPVFRLTKSSWNGTDLFSWSNLGCSPHLEMLCTERVVHLAESERWTNVSFKPIQTI